jgi:WD40 repeat protein
MATAAFNGTLRFFDPSTLEPLGDPVTGVAAFPAQLQFTPDGRTLVASGLDNTMRFFDVTTRREVGSPLAITTWGASISPDSDTIAISTDRGVQRLSIDGDDLARVVCRVAGRDLTAAEWAQYIGGHQHRLCPS